MSNRKVLAAVVLAAALVFPSVSRATPMLAEEVTPQWGYALGMSREESLVLGVGGAVMCGFIPGIGSVACGITGAL